MPELMPELRLVADENILALESYFSCLGSLKKLPGRSISKNDLQQCNALLIRSITPVNADLLDGTAVEFVATATSGVNHVDLNYLRTRGIEFADAAGANANAVAEYCLAALSSLVASGKFRSARKQLALIGAGNVGRKFYNKMSALGYCCQVYDPFQELQKTGSDLKFCSLESALQADIVSLHVPLTHDGPHPTYQMIGEEQLAMLKSGSVLINTCRGGVVNEQALMQKLRRCPDILTIVDVWNNEPKINSELVALVDIATPHIAGYSVEAKLAATRMVYSRLCRHFGISPDQNLDAIIDAPSLLTHYNEGEGANQYQLLLNAFPVHKLSEKVKALSQAGRLELEFDKLRKELANRREFSSYTFSTDAVSAELGSFLRKAGFAESSG